VLDACSGQPEFRMVSAKLPRPKPGTNHSRTSVQARHRADRMGELFLYRHGAMRLRPALAAQG
jgi:hypothetical protein